MSIELLIGINSVEAALEHDAGNVLELMFDGGTDNARVKELVEIARKHGIRPQPLPKTAIERMADGERHQGIVARYRAPPPKTEDDLDALITAAGNNALFLILDGVTDPHNLGACLRSAEAAGVTAVIAPKDRAASLTATVRRASAGAADRVPLISVTNLARALKVLKDHGVWLTGLAGEGTQTLYDVDLRGPVGIVMGGEGDGMRRLTRESCDFVALIPMLGKVESLNVSVACGIALFEALRQRTAKKK
jgi:23S rRNA (guanosine2251-2'-O)-methyltransferase